MCNLTLKAKSLNHMRAKNWLMHRELYILCWYFLISKKLKMFSAPKSAVCQILWCSVFKNIPLTKRSRNFQVGKPKFSTMDINKEKNLNKGDIKWDDIPSWKIYASEKSLPNKINTLPENSIDSSKNNVLVEKISVFSGDITNLQIDAIVNAANSSLLGGGGVDGAIHRAAGPSLLKECKTIGGCPTGEARMTGGYNLPAKHVIHTVGPMGEKPADLKNCYTNSLNIMVKNKLRTIAFPCISTGIYGYPNNSAAHVAAYAVRKFLEENADQVDRIIFCLFLDVDIKIYEGLLQSYFPLE